MNYYFKIGFEIKKKKYKTEKMKYGNTIYYL